MKTYGKKVKLTVLILLISLFIPLFSSLSFDVSAKNEKNGYDFTGIYLTREKISVKAGGSYTLSTREIGISKGEVKWSSENEEIASVTPDGEVIGHKCGITSVSAEKDGYKAVCGVIVCENDPAIAEYEHTVELMQDFLDLRFGMFLHFNSATYEFSAKGGDWGGESYQSTFKPSQWNPTKLDCRGWASAARSAGMTFAVLTTKHHDGFDLWDSAYTDYDIGSATLKTDVIAEYVKGCRAEGILPGLYFSMLDVKHKITSSSCSPSDVEFIKAQLRELVTSYGEIPFIIFDGWNAYWGGPHYKELPYEEIVNLVHAYQPNCLVINISCESNSSHSQIAMFESAAGQQVPEWFDNVNISCNTPTAHWFWCDSYSSATFKDVDWVLGQNVNPFAKSNTVFILNCSPNKEGVLIKSYTKLLSDIGKGYEKQADTVSIPERWAADYDYHYNLLFHKEAKQSSTESEGSYMNAPAIRAVDGYTDPDYAHATASRTKTEVFPWWTADIGYSADLGELKIYAGTAGKANAARLTVYISEEPFDNKSLSKGTPTSKAEISSFSVKKAKLSGDDCYTLDLGGIKGRYVAIVLTPKGDKGLLILSEVILTPKGTNDKRLIGTRDKIQDITAAAGTGIKDIPLPKSAYFITADGSLVENGISWECDDYRPDAAGTYRFRAAAEGSDHTFTVNVTVSGTSESAAGFTRVPVSKVSASSEWGEATGWAGIAHLASGDGITLRDDNILLSTHDNPYNATTMWHSADGVTKATLTFDLGKVTTVTNALIWNHNQLKLTDRGVKEMEIFVSSEGKSEEDWTSLGKYTLKKASGSALEPASNLLDLGIVDARYIRFELLSTHGSKTNIGMSEVMFLKAAGDTGAKTVLSSLISSFDLLSVYEYPEDKYFALSELCRDASSKLEKGVTDEEAGELAESLKKAFDELRALQSNVKVSGLTNVTFEIGKDSPALPSSMPLTVGGKTVDAEVIWNGHPTYMLSEKGSYTLHGRFKNTPYTFAVNLAVRGVSDDALTSLVAEYKSMNTGGYTDESAGSFRSALAAAENVLAKDGATQQDIDQAKSALKSAKYSLVPVSQVSGSPANEQEQTPEQKPSAPTGNRTAIIIALAALLAAVLSACVIIVVSKRKNSQNKV